MADKFCRHLASFKPNEGFFNMPQICDVGPTAYFPFEGRRAEKFFRPEKPDGFGRV
jgi:hypothetical protein